MKNIILILVIGICFASCDFNVNDIPGAQMSSSIAESRKHGAFLCAYRLKGNKLNNVEIANIFAEKQYWLDEGIFSKYKIDNSQSQLILVSKDATSDQAQQYDIEWKLDGFKSIHSLFIYKLFNGVKLPDTIPIKIVSINETDTNKIIKIDTLYKIR